MSNTGNIRFLVHRTGDAKPHWVGPVDLHRNELAGWHRRQKSRQPTRPKPQHKKPTIVAEEKEEEKAEEHGTVEKITKRRSTWAGGFEYYVHWAGPKKESWWVDEHDIDPTTIAAFNSGDSNAYWSAQKLRLAEYDVDEHYDARAVLSRENGKTTANHLFANSIVVRDGVVAYLEAEEGYTTDILKDKPNTLIAINMSLPVCNKIAVGVPAGTVVTCSTMSEFISTQSKHSIAALWHDACATWTGAAAATWSVKADVVDTLRRQVIVPGGVLGVTICLRDVRKSGEGVYGRTTRSVRDYIIRTARKYGYAGSRTLHTYRYGNMLLLVVRLGKQ